MEDIVLICSKQCWKSSTDTAFSCFVIWCSQQFQNGNLGSGFDNREQETVKNSKLIFSFDFSGWQLLLKIICLMLTYHQSFLTSNDDQIWWEPSFLLYFSRSDLPTTRTGFIFHSFKAIGKCLVSPKKKKKVELDEYKAVLDLLNVLSQCPGF